jgi:hypothetical protein
MKQCAAILFLLAVMAAGCSQISSPQSPLHHAFTPWVDEVVSVHYGTGAGFGQRFFPDNILGPPDTSASPYSPSFTEENLLTLGRGGEIILAFRDGGIYDSTGADFTVFGNPFVNRANNVVFRKVAIVAVSEDGAQWQEFPFDTTTFVGLAGATPTNGSSNPVNPAVSGGDSFDLATVGLHHAVYVKLTDATARVHDDGDSFNLDAVVAIHGG